MNINSIRLSEKCLLFTTMQLYANMKPNTSNLVIFILIEQNNNNNNNNIRRKSIICLKMKETFRTN